MKRIDYIILLAGILIGMLAAYSTSRWISAIDANANTAQSRLAKK